ncbi:hypothetical protein WA026_016629 [Henosepilachna vigintioctopunctata]|uniref:Uncharacterized protein n=1 Tax=Henosepilachna vigintioctopunctata TaxID=420089 RepID=A0AAW1VHG5_9CUCU
MEYLSELQIKKKTTKFLVTARLRLVTQDLNDREDLVELREKQTSDPQKQTSAPIRPDALNYNVVESPFTIFLFPKSEKTMILSAEHNEICSALSSLRQVIL